MRIFSLFYEVSFQLWGREMLADRVAQDTVAYCLVSI
jgi:hypothetical protein